MKRSLFYRPMPDFEPPKIEVPKLDENQLFLVSALSIIRATEDDVAAKRWLAAYESENLLPVGSLDGFLELLDIHCVSWH